MSTTGLAPGFLAANPLRPAAYPDSVTFQQVVFSSGDGDDEYADVSGLVDEDCRLMSVASMQPGEEREWAVQAGSTHVLQLPRYCETISEGMRPLVKRRKTGDGVPYELKAIRHVAYELTVVALSGVEGAA